MALRRSNEPNDHNPTTQASRGNLAPGSVAAVPSPDQSLYRAFRDTLGTYSEPHKRKPRLSGAFLEATAGIEPAYAALQAAA